jgi:hypothetical protein
VEEAPADDAEGDGEEHDVDDDAVLGAPASETLIGDDTRDDDAGEDAERVRVDAERARQRRAEGLVDPRRDVEVLPVG